MSAQFVFQYQPKSRLYYDDKSYQEAITKEQVCEAARKGNSDLKSDRKVDDDDDMNMAKPVKDESLGLVSVSRLKVPRLSVSSRSRTKFLNWSRLGLVSDDKFWDSLVSFHSILLSLVSVSSWPGCVVFKEIKPNS